MNKTLIIAEKPELARSIGEALIGNSHETDGVIENEKLIIVSAFGHLLQLREPEDYDEKYNDRQNLSLLPIYFKNWQKIPTKDKILFGKKQDNSYIRKRLKKIGELLKKTSVVIHAGDPDDEGQVLIDEILDYFHFQGKVYRVLLNDNLKENIQKQFQELQPNKSFRATGNAAYARQMADMCFGINHSRLASIHLKTPLTIGRVQSPVLNLVVTRDSMIEQHLKRKYYELYAFVKIDRHKVKFQFKPSEEWMDGEDHIYNRKRLEQCYPNYKGQNIKDIQFESKIKEETPPLPYNATELQADMNGRYGYSLSETLAITQTLRDKYKAITYNRSDCQFLKEEHYQEAGTLLPVVMNNLGRTYPVDLNIKSKCFDDRKISAHHAIIPQNKSIDLSVMTEKERNVYTAISERYILQFHSNLKRNVCKGRFQIDDNGFFEYNSSYIVDPGFKKYTDPDLPSNAYIDPFFNAGNYEGILQEFSVEEKETSPPKRYTPETLIKDMCSISKYVKDPEMKAALKAKDDGKEGEHGSIGTVATRADIIDKLVKRGYLEMVGKTIRSTQLGKEFCELLPEEIKSPDTTAKWWLIQEQIKQGQNPNFLLQVVVQDFNKHKDTGYKNDRLSKKAISSEKETYGKCPVCGKDVYKAKNKKTGRSSYYCSGYKEGCSFTLYEDFRRFDDTIHLTDDKVRKLLDHKTIKETLTTKDGKTYKANLILECTQKQGKIYSNLKIQKKK